MYKLEKLVLESSINPFIIKVLKITIIMGSSKSSTINLPSLDKQHWHEIPPPISSISKPSHGVIKLFRNIFTNEQVEEYSLTFESSFQFEQYLESFQWRLRDQNFVNTRYIDIKKKHLWCGQRQMIKVYIECIPLRLSSIQDIPQPQNLYFLLATLEGVQRLFRHIGSFKTNEDMIAIDREGRVKVWLNTNFSKNYLYSPNYIDGITDPLLGQPESQGEEAMVWNIVKMVQDNTSQQILSPLRISQWLRDNRGHLSFTSAMDKIKAYAKKFNITIPKYFQSIRNICNQNNQGSDLDSENFSIEFDKVQNHNQHMLPYIDPSEILSSQNSSMSNMKLPLSNQSFSLANVHQPTKLPLSMIFQSGLTTGDSTLIKPRNFSRIKSGNTINNESQIKEPAIFSNIPRITFNYSSIQETKRQYKTLDSPKKSIENSVKISLPLHSQRQKCEPTLRSLSSHSLVYSDIHKDYALDDQLVEDIFRFLKH